MSSPENPLPIPNAGDAPLVEVVPARPFPVWGLKEVAIVAVVAAALLFACIVIAAVAAIIFSHGHITKPDQIATNPLVALPPQLLAYVLTFIYVYRMLVHHFGMPFREGIGWQWPPRWLTFLGAGAMLAAVLTLVSAVLPKPHGLPIERLFETYLGAWMMAGFGIFIAPPAEELFFRGLLFPALAARVPVVFATLLTALGFTLLHGAQLSMAWAPMLILFVGPGVIFTVVRWRSRSLAASVLMHMGYNAALTIEFFWATRGFHNLAGK